MATEVFHNLACFARVVLCRGMADSALGIKTRNQFKYGCLHGVYGTPMIFIGGVMAESLDGGATMEDWKSVLDPLLAQDSAVSRR